MAKLPEQDIRKARESDSIALLETYGIAIEKRGKEHFALCPFHAEKSPSFTINPGMGRYFCHGCGAKGDNIQFVMDYEGVDLRTAVQKIIGTIDTEPAAPRERRVIEREEPEEWLPMALVPPDAPAPMDVINRKIHGTWHKLQPSARWEYHDADGVLIGYVYRFNKPDGGKEIVPQVYAVNQMTGEMQWRWLSFSKPRPIYGLDQLAANPKAQVLVVEGEKACNAARALFVGAGITPAKLIVVSWPGGGKAVPHVDWSPLFGRKVALFPDADQKPYKERHQRAGELMPEHEQPGFVAMRDIFDVVLDHCEGVKFIAPPVGVPDGWDLADELPAGFDLKAHMKTAQLAADVFAAVPEPTDEPAEPTPPWEDFPPDVEARAAGKEPVQPSPPAQAAVRPSLEERADEHDKLEDPGLSKSGHFRVLGYDHGTYYILQFEKAQIMTYSKSDFSEPGLIELAPLDWWEQYFPGGGKQSGICKKSAMNWLVRKAHSRGVYSMTRLRGRGAWNDKGRLVFHHGDYLTVDGKFCSITDMQSHYVYEMAEALPDIPEVALTDDEGMLLLDLAGIFRWAKPASAALLAGWCALAPIGGAIKWRPHLWLGGGAGSGKSSILNRYVHHLMNGMDVFANGNSSEAGIRQTLKGDARPVLFDESEQNNEKEAMRVQQVLSMVRQASTESQAQTFKGTAGGDAMAFHIRSMFCLASIQVGLKQQADIDRMTVLNILPRHDDPTPAETWKRIDEALYIMQKDETLPGRLVRRSLALLPVTLKNITTFAEAAAQKFGSQRDGDQYGTLMAGAWSLVSSDAISIDAARTYLDQYDWSEHRENNDVDEAERALAVLMGAMVRIHGGADVTVNELIRRAHDQDVDGLTMVASSAEAVLQRHGMRIEGKRLILSNTASELRALMSGTPFEADLRGVLLRLRGADRCNNRSIKFSGVASKAISIPIADLLTDDIAPAADGTVAF